MTLGRTFTLAALAAALMVTSPADAQRRGGGGGARGGGGAAAGARSGGAARADAGGTRNVDRAQSNIHRTDVNANRNTNVNVNRDVDVHGYGGYGYHGHHYDSWGAPFAAAAFATASVLAIGTIVASLPDDCQAVNAGGVTYQQCGGNLYQPVYQGSQVEYVVVNPP
jgi:hypothetical protein